MCFLWYRFLDSDGVYSNANAVLPANTSANPTAANVSRQAPINAMDQNWHMVTLTSLAQGVPGYRWVTLSCAAQIEAAPLHPRLLLLTNSREAFASGASVHNV